MKSKCVMEVCIFGKLDAKVDEIKYFLIVTQPGFIFGVNRGGGVYMKKIM
jgi:hypothetical protein